MSKQRIDKGVRWTPLQSEIHNHEYDARQDTWDESPPSIRPKRDRKRQQPENNQRHARIRQTNKRQPADDAHSRRRRKRRDDLKNAGEKQQTVWPRLRRHLESLGFHRISGCVQWRGRIPFRAEPQYRRTRAASDALIAKYRGAHCLRRETGRRTIIGRSPNRH